MSRITFCLAATAACVLLSRPALAQRDGPPPPSRPRNDATLLYADFEQVENGRPVSSRGGLIELTSYQENDVRRTVIKGGGELSPPAPALVRIKADDPNHAMKFDYALSAPNQWAGASVQVNGLPHVDGAPGTEDLSGYKNLSFQLYATGVEYIRVEVSSKGQIVNTSLPVPQTSFKVRPGLNTYKLPLKAFTYPAWAEVRTDPKDILKKLTTVSFSAYCDQCRPAEGMVIIDNITFEK